MNIRYRVYRINGRLRVQMFAGEKWPWYQAHRAIGSRKEVAPALKSFQQAIGKQLETEQHEKQTH